MWRKMRRRLWTDLPEDGYFGGSLARLLIQLSTEQWQHCSGVSTTVPDQRLRCLNTLHSCSIVNGRVGSALFTNDDTEPCSSLSYGGHSSGSRPIMDGYPAQSASRYTSFHLI